MKNKISFKYCARCLLLITLFSSLIPFKAVSQKISTDALRSHTYFLSHDLLEGRGTASHGEALAALYLSTHLRMYGLKPITTDSTLDYRIPVPLTAYHFDDSETHISIQSEDSSFVLSPPDFYHPGGAPSSFQNFGGKLLFAGPTPNALSTLNGYSDLTGKVVVLGPPWNGIGEVESELRRRGAEGAIEIVPNEFYNRLRVVRGPTRYSLPTEVKAPKNQSPLPTVIIGPTAAKALGVYKKIESKNKLDKAEPLQSRVEINFSIDLQQKTGYNVAALLPGADPVQSDSIVIYMAHYDHVGHGEPTNGDSLWNGFIDNSTGTSLLLEMARILSDKPPSHSTVFLFTTAEEQGLLGATWFVQDPPIQLNKIKAAINIDGGAPPADEKNWTIAASNKYKLKDIAGRALENNGWEVTEKSIISDSDHWPFHRAGIPALFLYPGSQVTTEHIHTAKDEWYAEFPFGGLSHYAEAALRISRALEN